VALRYALQLCIAAVIVITILQIRSWRKVTVDISSMQKVFRILEAILLIGIMWMILDGGKSLTQRFGMPVLLIYWPICFFMSVAVTILAMLDIREIGMKSNREREQNFLNLLESCKDEIPKDPQE